MKQESNETRQIKLRCPNCRKENAIYLSRDIACTHCGKSLGDKKYIKPMVSGMTVAIIAFAGGIKLDDYLEKNRYPVNVEYALIESCISAAEEPLAVRVFDRKKEICQDALVRTQHTIDFGQYKAEPDTFIAEYEKQCISIIVEKKKVGVGGDNPLAGSAPTPRH